MTMRDTDANRCIISLNAKTFLLLAAVMVLALVAYLGYTWLLIQGIRYPWMTSVPITLPATASVRGYDEDGPGPDIAPWVGRTWYVDVAQRKPADVESDLVASLSRSGWLSRPFVSYADGTRVMSFKRGSREQLTIEVYHTRNRHDPEATFMLVEHRQLYPMWKWLWED